MSDAAGTRIAVYVTPTCPHCRATREFLTGLGVPFDVYDVTVDRKALQRLIWLTGRATVPTTIAGSDALIGFDASRLQEMVEAVTGRTGPSETDADEG